ncbi:Crp/Fnr family transcriptional regulator [Undibacterium sp.]|uniref:Crp/Fnr family transcriptional regulator n=1 Tax=Undibacterium sp. TaxID=1914977 RepID=UPI00374CFAE4
MPSNLDLLPQLSANPWFGSLPLRERKIMLAGSELQRLRPGEMLFRQGDPPGNLHALVSGVMKMSTLSKDGKEAILVVLEPGTWFGEISLIDNKPRTHDSTAMGDVEILTLPRPVFDTLMESNVFARAISSMLAARIRMLYGIVEDATLRSTRARIARRLLLLARGDATMSTQVRPRLPVSQESLAMMLGITRQTLSRELKLLVEQDAIHLGYAYIEVVSESKLKAFSESAR